MENNYKKYTWMAGTTALVALAFASLAFGIQNLDAVNHPSGQIASISVQGDGEVTAVPDIAEVTFTVNENAKTVPEAQKLAEAKVAQALKDLSTLGVDKKDVKTLSYTVNPHYETKMTGVCTAYACPPQTSVVNGYEVRQSVSVKVRKVDQAGEVFGILGKVNITDISGPNFTVDDMDKVKENAKALAIADAKEKAKVQADALGVSLGTVLSFSEDNGGYYPMMYARADAMSVGGVAESKVSLPQGENVIKSHVTITYTIK
jgi:uncharacterized protein YggE